MAGNGRKKSSEVQKLSDPNFLVEVGVGPPTPTLVPQRPGTGVVVGGQYADEVKRFIWKKAHFSLDDNRIFDKNGRLVAVSYHWGKNPYESLDPLNVIPDNPVGEWESVCYISGYDGMPQLKVRPAAWSLHGRQYIYDCNGERSYCNIASVSRLKTMSVRRNFAVFAGDEDSEPTYTVLVDLAGRTMQLVNANEERVAVFTKSVETLILNATLGVGSEFTIDVAPGVDWTAMLAICIGLNQVGKSYQKDAMNNFLVDPAKDAAMGYALNEALLVADGIQSGEIEVPELGEIEVPEIEVPEVEVPEEVSSFFGTVMESLLSALAEE